MRSYQETGEPPRAVSAAISADMSTMSRRTRSQAGPIAAPTAGEHSAEKVTASAAWIPTTRTRTGRGRPAGGCGAKSKLVGSFALGGGISL